MDWIAGILELTGLWKLGNKSKWGFIFNAICCSLWILHVFINQTTYGLLVVVVPALFLNFMNFAKWSKKDLDSKK